MADKILQINYSKFIINLVTALRKIPLYPSNHPAVLNSIKNIFLPLSEILKEKETFTLSLSVDNKIIIENGPVTDKNMSAQDIAVYLKKLDIENITFSAGLTEKEVGDFVRLMLLGKEEFKKMGDIAKIFQDKAIQHVKVDQFSYIKIEKDKQAVVVELESASHLEKLKSKLKEYLENKLIKPEDIQPVENEIFGMIAAEYKEKKKISFTTKNIFKKFFQHHRDKENVLTRIKNTLLDSGFAQLDVDNLMQKLEEEAQRKSKAKQPQISDEAFKSLSAENEDLKLKLSQFQQESEKKSVLLGELQKQSRVVIAEKQRLDNVMHHMAEGMVVVDAQGKLLMVNPVAERLLGVSKQDIGRPIKELLKDEHLLALAKNLSSDKEGVMQKDIELLSPNEATRRVLKTSSAVIEDPNGNTVGMVTILNDITRQRELENLKSGFLSNVSHELRSPLIAIEKSISLILSKATGEVTSDQEQFLSSAERNLKRLTLLINDLLDLSKLEAGKMTVRPQASSMGKIIAEAVKTFETWAKQKSLKIETNIQEGLPEINADSNRIIQVLNNLFSNAIKFTPNSGSIAIEARLCENEMEVAVADTGIGIAKENLAKIFEKFYQVEERAPDEVGGTGIGLSVSKEIVELHGGKIWAESEKGKGTKIIFTLPLQGNVSIQTEG